MGNPFCSAAVLTSSLLPFCLDAALLRVSEKLEAKRAEREAELRRLEEEAAKLNKQRMFQGAAKSAVEERHFEQQVMAQERKLAAIQAQALAVRPGVGWREL